MATVERIGPGNVAAADQLKAKVSELTERMMAAIKARDPYTQADIRLERAWVEMQLRDLYGPWSRAGDRYGAWMRDDVRIARTLADTLALKLGDSGIPARLLQPYPALEWVVAW